MIPTAWSLVGLALLFTLLGAFLAALFLCLAAGGLAILAPTDEQQDAYRRNHARRVR